MTCFDLTLPTLAENLAFDHALTLSADAAPPQMYMRFWELPTLAVVLGAGGKIADDVDLDACERDGVPLGRRASGGGTVLLGPGCLLYSLVLPFDADPALASIDGSYRFILACMIAALGHGVHVSGSSDLTADDAKFSGNAQERKRFHLLHHGTLLYDFDVDAVGRYLREPPKQPAYRHGRPHAAFVRNWPLTRGELTERVRLAWGAAWGDAPAEALGRVAGLVAERFGEREWIERR